MVWDSGEEPLKPDPYLKTYCAGAAVRWHRRCVRVGTVPTDCGDGSSLSSLGIFNGLSVASILLLVALGLAITFGLMNVINMAHGQFIMIGAYVAYVSADLTAAVFGQPSAGNGFVAGLTRGVRGCRAAGLAAGARVDSLSVQASARHAVGDVGRRA